VPLVSSIYESRVKGQVSKFREVMCGAITGKLRDSAFKAGAAIYT